MADNNASMYPYTNLSEVEQIRFRRIIDLQDEARAYLKDIENEARTQTVADLSNAAAYWESVEQNGRNNALNDITIAAYEIEKADIAARSQLDAEIEAAVQGIVGAGMNPIMGNAERIYYETLPLADAYNMTRLSDTTPITTQFEQLENLGLNGGEAPFIPAPLPPKDHIGAIQFTAATPPPPPPPPVVIIPPPVSVPPIPGFRTCYLIVDGADGRKESIPVTFADTGSCPPGYAAEPYINPPPPPPPPASNKGDYSVTVPAVAEDQPQFYLLQAIDECRSKGGEATWSKNGTTWNVTCIVPPPPPIPPAVDPSTLCDPWSQVWDNVLGKCVTKLANANECNFPIFNLIYGKDTKIQDDPAPCPPGCVKIDSLIGNEFLPAMPCMNWDNIDVCDKVSGSVSIVASGSNPDNKLSTIQGMGKLASQVGGIGGMIASFSGGVMSLLPSVFGGFLGGGASKNMIIEASTALMTAGFGGGNKIVSKKAEECKLSVSTIVDNMFQLATAGWADRLSAAPVSYLFTENKYALQYEYPQFIPSQSEIDLMYLTAAINETAWKCYTKANGNLPNLHTLNMQTKRTRIDPRQSIFLNRYGKLKDDEYESTMRSLGFLSVKDRKQYEDSLVTLPGISDILRMAVRDVENKEVYEKYEYDTGFDKSYKDTLQLWAKSQGIPDDVAKFYWRAHWDLPSNTAAYEMLRRNREGRVDPKLVVTHKDVQDLLKINDMAPGWIDKIISISAAVVTRTDLKRGMLIEALDKTQVIDGLKDNGYIDRDADLIYSIFEKEKDLYEQTIAARRSAFTPKQVANMLADGSMTAIEAKDELVALKLKPEAISRIIESGNAKSKSLRRRACLKSIKRRYFSGQLTDVEAFDHIGSQGVDVATQNSILDGWRCEFTSRSKDLPASKNVELFLKGVINADELGRRLRNLNYSDQAVAGWISSAMIKHRENMEKAAAKALREQLAERARLQREQDRANRILRQLQADAKNQQSPIPLNNPASGASA